MVRQCHRSLYTRIAPCHGAHRSHLRLEPPVVAPRCDDLVCGVLCHRLHAFGSQHALFLLLFQEYQLQYLRMVRLCRYHSGDGLRREELLVVHRPLLHPHRLVHCVPHSFRTVLCQEVGRCAGGSQPALHHRQLPVDDRAPHALSLWHPRPAGLQPDQDQRSLLLRGLFPQPARHQPGFQPPHFGARRPAT